MTQDPHSASEPPQGYRPVSGTQHGQHENSQQYGTTEYNSTQYNAAASDPAQHNPNHYSPDQPSAEQHPLAADWAAPPKPVKNRRGLGAGAVTSLALVVGLLAGGVGAAGYAALIDSDDAQAGSSAPQSDIQVNSPEDATPVTAAAAQASPSVVTLEVTGENSQGSGSGIILDSEGHVLTNTHVVTLGGATGDPNVNVRLSDGRVASAELVGTDPLSDLAVIKIDGVDDLEPAELGSSSDLNVGDRAIAIGAPLGLAGTVTDGIISTLDRTISVQSSAAPEDAETEEVPEQEIESEGEGFEFFFPNQPESSNQGSIFLNVIQTDASINQGNSGGALVDSEGRIIGVNVAIASTGGADPFSGEENAGSIGVGFSIPIDYAQRVAEEIIENGEATHGLLGVTVTAASTDAEANQRLLEGDAAGLTGSFTVGALVNDVPESSPAADAGIQRGDIITHVEGRRIDDSSALTATVREYATGDTIAITVERDGSSEELDVTLAGM